MSDEHIGRDASDFQEEGAPTGSSDAYQSRQSFADDASADSGMEALLRESEYNLRSIRRGETVEGTVVRVDEDEVLVDVGMKSEGVIPARELYSESEESTPLRVGERILVYVMHPEGSEGHAILSLRRARMERSWREIEESYHQGAIIEAPVVDFNKGGLIVDVRGVRGFVPVSQVLDLRNISRQEGENEEVNQALATMQSRRLPLKIIEINRSRNRLILSERAAVQEQRTARKDELMEGLEAGQIRRGTVSNLTTFGAFVDLGGADGLVHVSELSYNRVNHPSEILRVGQEIDVMVLSVDRDTKKIALSLKRALPDPWTTVEQTYRLGEVVPATITKLAKFGAFAKVEEGLEGLIHLTELTDLPVQDPSQVVREGDAVNVKIIHINSQRRRLGLSVRQAGEQPAGTQSFGELDATSPFAPAAETTASTDDALETETTEDVPVEAEPVEAAASPFEDGVEPEPSTEARADVDTQHSSVSEDEGNLPPVSAESPAPSAEGALNAGEQNSTAAESGPHTVEVESDVAVAPVEASSALPEESLPGDDDNEAEIASPARQGSA